jgi:hypothetical protein
VWLILENGIENDLPVVGADQDSVVPGCVSTSLMMAPDRS